MKTSLKFFLIGFACAFVYIVWHILSLCYVRLYFTHVFDSFLEWGLILTLIFYCAVFFAIGYLLYQNANNFCKKREIMVIVLGWLLGTALIFWDLTFGYVLNLVIEPIFEWASAGVVVFFEGTNAVINYRFRDDLPIMSFLAIILNFTFPIITFLITWIMQVARRKKIEMFERTV